MKTLLIRPPLSRLRGTGHTAYFPLGIGYLAGTLKAAGHNVAIYNADNARHSWEIPRHDKESVFENRSEGYHAYQKAIKDPKHYVWEEVKQTLLEQKPDVVGITVLTVEAGAALMLSKLVKEALPGTPVVWGGVHPTYLPNQCLRYPEVDAVVRGEGEQIIVRLMEALAKKESPGDIESVSYRLDDGSIRENPLAPLIDDLDAIPHPARETALYPETFQFGAWGSLIGSRGCPWRCAFCTSRDFWLKKVRFRSPQNIIEEIRIIKEQFGCSVGSFWDDSFSIKRKWVYELCQGLVDAKIGFTWRTATRGDLVSEEMLGLMRNAGCVQLEIGVETGSPRMSEIIKKDVSLDRILESVAMINKVGIASGTFFMAGFPEETEEDLRQTWEFMKKVNSTDVVLNVFDPMPGASSFDTAVQMGIINPDRDWTDFPLWPDAHHCQGIEKERFDQLVREIAHWVYDYNNSLSVAYRRLKPKVKSYLRTDPKAVVIKGASFLKKAIRRKTLKITTAPY